MRRRSFCVATLVALLLGVGLTHGQDASGPGRKRARTLEDFKPRTLKEIAAAGQGAESRGDKAETMTIQGDVLPTRVTVKYAGSWRPLPPHKGEVLRQWARLYAGDHIGYVKPYETELLFTEGGAEFWLAVRRDDGFLQDAHELERGELFELYLIRVGAAKLADKWEPVLLVEGSSLVIRD